MSLQNIGIGVAVVLSVIAIALGIVGFGGSHPAGNLTQTNLQTNAPANATSFVGPYGVESDAGFFDAAGAISNLLGGLAFSSNTATRGPTIQGVAGNCANSASSTQFAVKAPSGATSTADVEIFVVGGNATTSSFYVGTSTTPAVTATTSLSSTLINAASIPTSTIENLSGGVTVGPATNFVSAGANTFTSIVVAPNNYILGFATTTATNAGAANYIPGFTTCSYKIIYTN